MDLGRDSSKEEQITQALITRIRSGEMAAGERLQPVRVLAEVFQTSLSVVDRAFGNLEKLGLLERRPRSGTFVRALHPHPLRAALVLLYLRDIHAQFPGPLQRALTEAGYIVSLFDIEVLQRDPSLYYHFLKTHPELVVMDYYSESPEEWLARIPKGVRTILCHRCEKDIPVELNCSKVMIDMERIGYESARQLIAWGRRRLLILTSVCNLPQMIGSLYIAGATRALAEVGLAPAGLVTKPDIFEADLLPYFAEGLKCDAILGRDSLLVAASEVAGKFGYTFPNDFDLMGFANTPWSQSYRFSSFDFQVDEMARRVVAAAGHNRREHELIAPQEVIRRHSGAAVPVNSFK